MMTGNGADIECYADRENQPVQMAVRFWIARNSQLQAIQRAELFRQSAFLLFEIAFNAVTNILGDFQRVTQCIQVTAFHKMVNINSRATQEIDFQRLFFIADPGSQALWIQRLLLTALKRKHQEFVVPPVIDWSRFRMLWLE